MAQTPAMQSSACILIPGSELVAQSESIDSRLGVEHLLYAGTLEGTEGEHTLIAYISGKGTHLESSVCARPAQAGGKLPETGLMNDVVGFEIEPTVVVSLQTEVEFTDGQRAYVVQSQVRTRFAGKGQQITRAVAWDRRHPTLRRSPCTVLVIRKLRPNNDSTPRDAYRAGERHS